MNSNNYRLLYKEENGLDIYAIKTDNGKICLYWKNKNSSNISNIIVIFNNSNNIKINSNQICISLDGLNNINEIKHMLNMFSNEIKKLGIDIKKIKVTYIIDNQQQKDELEAMDIELELNVEYQRSNNYQEVQDNKRVIETQQQQSNVYGATDSIKRYKGNKEESFVISDENIYNDNDTLSIAEGQVRIVNPTVTNTSINSQVGINNTTTSSYGYQTQDANPTNEQAASINEEQIESREVINTYYLESDGKTIIDTNDNVIGTIGTDGYLNYNDNLYQNGQLIGKLGEKSQNKSNFKDKTKVHVYKPETPSYPNHQKEKNAAFISLPVIIFIISLILLIGSGIILFLMK